MNYGKASDSDIAQAPLDRLLALRTAVDSHEIPWSANDRITAVTLDRRRSIVSLRGSGAPTWLTNGEWRLLARVADVHLPKGSEVIAEFARSSGRPVHVWRDPLSGSVIVPFSFTEVYENYVYERWRTISSPRQLTASQLKFFYSIKRAIPRRAQLAGRRTLAKWQRGTRFPAWPYDDSVASLVRFYARCAMLANDTDKLEFRWFWPQQHRAALILTHDVESADGLRLALELADLEEERGLRSSFNIVAEWYPVDMAIISELKHRGFELGVHGVYHDRSMFASRQGFEKQLPKVAAWATAIQAAGFRSPATHRVVDWLGELPLEYDCTMPHSDPYEPIPGGACTPWPFFIGDVVELPYTLPQDHTVFTVLGKRGIDIWLEQVDTLEKSFGLIQSVTHPDRGYLGDAEKRARYSELLDVVRERDALWKTLPRDAAQWWRDRDAGHSAESLTGVLRVLGDDVTIAPPK